MTDKKAKMINQLSNQDIQDNSADENIECLNEYVLIKVFNYLKIDDKLNCTKVCRSWERILNSTICRPKKLSLTVNNDVSIKELNNLNCDHFNSDNEIDDNCTLLIDYFNQNLLDNELFSNLHLIIINLIFIDYSPVLNLSQLINLKHLEIHGDYYEFKEATIYPSVEHLFIEQFKSNLFQHFPNLKCLCLNQLKIDQNELSSNLLYNTSLDASFDTSSCNSTKSTANQTKLSNQFNCCNSLNKLKINDLPVQFSNHNQNDLIRLISLMTPNLEQLYICLSLYENDDDLSMEINSSKLIENNVNSNQANTNCTMNKMVNLIKRLKKLKLMEIEFDLDSASNLNAMNSLLLNLSSELTQLKLQLNTNLKFSKSLDLNSTDRFEFSNFLKANYANELNEIIINGRRFRLKELNGFIKCFHLINVEELYVTSRELNLLSKPTIYDYLKQVNTLCFELNPGIRLNEILTNLNHIKYIYFNCKPNQDQLNLISILKSDLEYLAIEEFEGKLDADFLFKFNCLRSLYLGRIECLNTIQFLNLIKQSKHLTHLNIECRLFDKSLDQLIEFYASNAKQSNHFYHLNLSLFNYQIKSYDCLDNIVKSYNKISNLKISFYGMRA